MDHLRDNDDEIQTDAHMEDSDEHKQESLSQTLFAQSTLLQSARPIISDDVIPIEPYEDREYLQYISHMPDYLQEDNFDILIINADTDNKAAETFRNHLEKDMLFYVHGEPRSPRVKLLNDIRYGSMDHLDLAFSKALYVFLYVTNKFCEEQWTLLQGQACLTEAVRDQDKKWCVVPIHTTSKKNQRYKLPMMLNSLRPINYWSGGQDQFYIEGVRKLLECKIGDLLERDRLLDEARRNYFMQHCSRILKNAQYANVSSVATKSSTLKYLSQAQKESSTVSSSDYGKDVRQYSDKTQKSSKVSASEYSNDICQYSGKTQKSSKVSATEYSKDVYQYLDKTQKSSKVTATEYSNDVCQYLDKTQKSSKVSATEYSNDVCQYLDKTQKSSKVSASECGNDVCQTDVISHSSLPVKHCDNALPDETVSMITEGIDNISLSEEQTISQNNSLGVNMINSTTHNRKRANHEVSQQPNSSSVHTRSFSVESPEHLTTLTGNNNNSDCIGHNTSTVSNLTVTELYSSIDVDGPSLQPTTVVGGLQPMINSNTTSASSPHNVASSPHNIASSPHNIASSPHNIASSPHNIASSPHNVASSPHNIVSSPHNIASSPHNIASSPHNIAYSPHHIASSPHNVASSPHNITSSPHNIVSSPHNIAFSPYSVAFSPHNIASSPHNVASSTYNVAPPSTANSAQNMQNGMPTSFDPFFIGMQNPIAHGFPGQDAYVLDSMSRPVYKPIMPYQGTQHQYYNQYQHFQHQCYNQYQRFQHFLQSQHHQIMNSYNMQDMYPFANPFHQNYFLHNVNQPPSRTSEPAPVIESQQRSTEVNAPNSLRSSMSDSLLTSMKSQWSSPQISPWNSPFQSQQFPDLASHHPSSVSLNGLQSQTTPVTPAEQNQPRIPFLHEQGAATKDQLGAGSTVFETNMQSPTNFAGSTSGVSQSTANSTVHIHHHHHEKKITVENATNVLIGDDSTFLNKVQPPVATDDDGDDSYNTDDRKASGDGSNIRNATSPGGASSRTNVHVVTEKQQKQDASFGFAECLSPVSSRQPVEESLDEHFSVDDYKVPTNCKILH